MRICNRNLRMLEEKGVKVPSYGREGLRPSIVHIGLGHFHRSHFLTYMDELLCKGAWDSGVFEVDIIPSDASFISSLREQDYMYSVLSLAPDGSEELRINGPVTGYANLSSEPEEVMSMLSSPDIRLITLTITEKGYCYRDDIGSLDFDNPGIRHDLETDDLPLTAVGCLARAMKIRSEHNLPVTVMSCDNVPENGRMLESCIMQFCQRKYPECIGWMKENASFPCTMVDRITPGTTADDIRSISEAYGIEDSCPVRCEAFMQWVIEDRFRTEIPDFSRAGAMIVDDVRPYELMKIRLLNGSHSALSYPAYMMGITRVDEAMDNHLIRTFIRDRYMEEITATLSPVPGMDLSSYKDQLISRFSNPYISDTILRLASDGSKKISNAILRPLEEAMGKGLPASSIIFALALWQYYYIFRDADGSPMPIDDPKRDELLSAASDPSRFLRIAGLSDAVLARKDVVAAINDHIADFKAAGVAEAFRLFMERA